MKMLLSENLATNLFSHGRNQQNCSFESYLWDMMTNRLNGVFCLKGALKLLELVPAVPLNNAVLMTQTRVVVL